MEYKKWREAVEYTIKTGTPEQAELCKNWLAGIGLQQVDNLNVSGYLLELALQNIRGEIEFSELERKLEDYHSQNKNADERN